MLVIYNPELENPARDKDVSLGFSLITGQVVYTEYVQLKPGVNRDISPELWSQIQEMPMVPELLELGALKVEEDIEVISEAPTAKGGLSSKSVKASLDLISRTFDLNLLNEWDRSENRVRIKNSIQKRIQAITSGEA